MSRLKQIQRIDALVEAIEVVTKSQCSLSEQDIKLLQQVLVKLKSLKRKKGKTNGQILKESADVVRILTKFLSN
ncbi:MAG: hypothetical protein ACOYW3_15260 [Bacteroidota bacterium]